MSADAVPNAAEQIPDAAPPGGGRAHQARLRPALTNEDLAPLHKQNWSSYNIFAFWMSDVHSVGGYLTAGSLFALGIAGWQVLIALLIGIVIVQIFVNLVAKPSQKTGVPYPVINRAIFGVKGANIPAIIRGLIAVAWYGVQTYLAAESLNIIFLKFIPACAGAHAGELPRARSAGLDLLRDPLGGPGGAVLDRHGDHPPVHRLGGPRGVRRHGHPGDLPGDQGGLVEHRPQPAQRRDAQLLGLDPGHDHRDRDRRVVLLRPDAQLRRLLPLRAQLRGGQAAATSSGCRSTSCSSPC